MTDDEPTDEEVRSIAKAELASGLELRNRLLDEHAASFRWLIATLFAANGGALVALAGLEDVPPYAKVWACGWFSLGILASLLTARFNQQMIQRSLQPMNNLVAFWGCVAHGMEFEVEKHEKLVGALQDSAKRSWPVQACGWIAAVVFVFGMVAAGTGYWSNAVTNDHASVEMSK